MLEYETMVKGNIVWEPKYMPSWADLGFHFFSYFIPMLVFLEYPKLKKIKKGGNIVWEPKHMNPLMRLEFPFF